jgi:RNA ligase
MNQFQKDLYRDLMALCGPEQEAFYYVDQKWLNFNFRIFLYRLASYTDFLKPGALECRGHTFRIDEQGNALEFVSMPMNKFFNLGENPFVMELDLSGITHVMDKLDGSLISTVKVDDQFILKSKGSLNSTQAQDATRLLDSREYVDLKSFCQIAVERNYTVNMEYMAPDNRIVIGYAKPTLKVLNVRNNEDGSYYDVKEVIPGGYADFDFHVNYHPIPEDPQAWVESVYKTLDDIEGYVVRMGDLWFKVKTEKYAALHKTKDSITVPRRLFETCVTGGADDLRGMFATDPVAVQQIDEMQEKVAKIYNHLHASVHGFFCTHRYAYNDTENPRKYFALAAQADADIMKQGAFGLVMNLYLGKEVDIEGFMIKNYKKYGIKDEADLPVETE